MVDWCFCIHYSPELLQNVIAIVALSAPGCLLRIVLTEFTHDILYQQSSFRLAPSITTNLIGCFIMGFHEGFAPSRSDKYVKAGIATGFAGSVTTFSSFNFEINQFIVSDTPNIAAYLVSIAVTFIGGIFLYFCGEFISLRIFKERKQHKLLKKNDDDEDMELDEIKNNEKSKQIIQSLERNNFFDDDVEKNEFIHLFESFNQNTQICLKDAICKGYSYPNDDESKLNKLLMDELKYSASKVYKFHSILLFDYLKINDLDQKNVIDVVSKTIKNHKYKQQIMKNVNEKQINGEKLRQIIIEKDVHSIFDDAEIKECEWNKLNEFVSNNSERNDDEAKETDLLTSDDGNEQKEESEDSSDESQNGVCMNDGFILLLWIFLLVAMYSFCIPVSFLLSDRAWEAMILSPVGALTRWYLGKVLNGHKKSPIPLGTFVANIFGSLLFTILHVASDDKSDIWYKYYEMGLAGILEGYCGCLTTISSFVHEKVQLKRKAANERKDTLKTDVLTCEHEMKTYKVSIIYFFLTLIVAQILTSVVNIVCYFRPKC